MKLIQLRITLMICAALIAACSPRPIKRELRAVSEIKSINPKSKFLKAHMRDGSLYILSSWKSDETSNQVKGRGRFLDINRRVLKDNTNLEKKDTFTLNVPDIAIIETNETGNSVTAGIAIVTGISVTLTLACITNPKACFGSCPTFYAPTHDSVTLQAEGFSTSVAPSLEANDIDMLYHAKPSRDFQLTVTNEALETHMINHANLLVFPKPATGRIFATPQNNFYQVHAIDGAEAVTIDGSSDKHLTELFGMADGKEYFSAADGKDLQSKEEVILKFASSKERPALVIGKRQTLLTTFLMYQGLSYMGHTAAHWLAEMERGRNIPGDNIFRLLGGIDVLVRDENGEWILQGTVNETGPIASDFQIIPLKVQSEGPTEIKLRMTKGLWRVDYVALGSMGDEVRPVSISPSAVQRVHGKENEPLTKLLQPDKYLITYPGDKYLLNYQLPFEQCEIFLDSRGYYLEWMRDEWVKEQNIAKLRTLIKKPEKFLRMAAPAYKKIEPSMEKNFWESRYVTH